MAHASDWSDWRRLLEVGTQFTALTRAEAQRRAQELVREGQLAQERVQAFADDLVRASRERADDLVDVVRKELQHQIETLGIATKADLDRLETRVQRAEKAAGKTPKAGTKRKTAADGKKKSPPRKKAGTRKPSGSS